MYVVFFFKKNKICCMLIGDFRVPKSSDMLTLSQPEWAVWNPKLSCFKPQKWIWNLIFKPNIFLYVGYICEVSNPNYKVIDGSCYYFETTTELNYEDAQTNCLTKFGNLMGGLFEPRTTNTNQLVFDEAVNFVTSLGLSPPVFWLGINDLATQG